MRRRVVHTPPLMADSATHASAEWARMNEYGNSLEDDQQFTIHFEAGRQEDILRRPVDSQAPFFYPPAAVQVAPSSIGVLDPRHDSVMYPAQMYKLGSNTLTPEDLGITRRKLERRRRQSLPSDDLCIYALLTFWLDQTQTVDELAKHSVNALQLRAVFAIGALTVADTQVFVPRVIQQPYPTSGSLVRNLRTAFYQEHYQGLYRRAHTTDLEKLTHFLGVFGLPCPSGQDHIDDVEWIQKIHAVARYLGFEFCHESGTDTCYILFDKDQTSELFTFTNKTVQLSQIFHRLVSCQRVPATLDLIRYFTVEVLPTDGTPLILLPEDWNVFDHADDGLSGLNFGAAIKRGTDSQISQLILIQSGMAATGQSVGCFVLGSPGHSELAVFACGDVIVLCKGNLKATILERLRINGCVVFYHTRYLFRYGPEAQGWPPCVDIWAKAKSEGYMSRSAPRPSLEQLISCLGSRVYYIKPSAFMHFESQAAQQAELPVWNLCGKEHEGLTYGQILYAATAANALYRMVRRMQKGLPRPLRRLAKSQPGCSNSQGVAQVPAWNSNVQHTEGPVVRTEDLAAPSQAQLDAISRTQLTPVVAGVAAAAAQASPPVAHASPPPAAAQASPPPAVAHASPSAAHASPPPASDQGESDAATQPDTPLPSPPPSPGGPAHVRPSARRGITTDPTANVVRVHLIDPMADRVGGSPNRAAARQAVTHLSVAGRIDANTIQTIDAALGSLVGHISPSVQHSSPQYSQHSSPQYSLPPSPGPANQQLAGGSASPAQVNLNTPVTAASRGTGQPPAQAVTNLPNTTAAASVAPSSAASVAPSSASAAPTWRLDDGLIQQADGRIVRPRPQRRHRTLKPKGLPGSDEALMSGWGKPTDTWQARVAHLHKKRCLNWARLSRDPPDQRPPCWPEATARVSQRPNQQSGWQSLNQRSYNPDFHPDARRYHDNRSGDQQWSFAQQARADYQYHLSCHDNRQPWAQLLNSDNGYGHRPSRPSAGRDNGSYGHDVVCTGELTRQQKDRDGFANATFC